jgi:hypothetical protein
MSRFLDFEISAQPDEVTCGPTCLQGIYRYFADELPLEQVLEEVRMLDEGGTLDVFLGVHALERGYRATLYTYNLQLFDPTWFALPPAEISERLARQARAKRGRKLQAATRGYRRFLELGGRLRFEDLRPALIRSHLRRGIPIMTGLSATYLYQDMREDPSSNTDDDIRGDPSGHFVVVHGYDKETRRVMVADPYRKNPLGDDLYYAVDMHRLIGAILLGCLTYDANLLVIQPGRAAHG